MTTPVTPGRSSHSLSSGGSLKAIREMLTVDEFCAEMRIARSTFYDWLAKGRAPRCRKLPNGKLRIARRDIETWFDTCEVAA